MDAASDGGARTPGEVRPRRQWYVVAAVIVVVTAVAVVAMAIPLVTGMVETFSLQHVEAPGRGEVHLAKAGEYSIYADVGWTKRLGAVTLSETRSPPTLQLTVTRADSGEQLPLGEPDRGTTLTIQNRQYRPIHTFSVDRPGTVSIEAGYPAGTTGPGVTLAVGPRFGVGGIFRSIARIFLIVGVALVGATAALVVFLVTFVRRRSALRRLSSSPAVPAADRQT